MWIPSSTEHKCVVGLCQKASTTSCSKPLESARADGPARAWLLRCPRSGRRRLPRTAPPAPRCPAQRPPEASTAAHPAPRCPAQRLPEASTGRAPAPRCPAQRPPEAATGRTSAAASAPQASPPAEACAILAAHHALRQTVRRAPSAAPWPPHRRYVAPRSGRRRLPRAAHPAPRCPAQRPPEAAVGRAPGAAVPRAAAAGGCRAPGAASPRAAAAGGCRGVRIYLEPRCPAQPQAGPQRPPEA